MQAGNVPPVEEVKEPAKPKVNEDRIARAMRLALKALKLSQEGGAEIEGKKKVDEQGKITYEFNLSDLEDKESKGK